MSKKVELVECDSCGFKTTCEPFDYPVHHCTKEQAMLCAVCSGSFCSHGIFYPKQSDSIILRSLGYCTNMILNAIREAQRDE